MSPTQSPSDSYILRLEEQLAEALHREQVALDTVIRLRERQETFWAALRGLLEEHDVPVAIGGWGRRE